jgi:hypothetical protein
MVRVKTRRTVARIAALVFIVGGFTVMQGNSEPAQAAPLSTRSWTYFHVVGGKDGPNITTTLTYSPTDTPYDAVVRACRAAGHPVPPRGSDLEKLTGKHANFWTEQAKGGYAAEAFMSLVGNREFASDACAGGQIQER